MVLVLANPLCGDRSGLQFVTQHVLPLLSHRDYELYQTTAPGDVGGERLQSHLGNTIIVASGDGTLHDLINSLYSSSTRHPGPSSESDSLDIVLIPTGTANALYSSLFPPELHPDHPSDSIEYKLLSLKAYLNRHSKKQLSIQKTSFFSSSSESVTATHSLLSLVVTSTALHASILHVADTLRDREDLPGVERFKEAAKLNISNWYESHVRLKPTSASGGDGTGTLQRYNPSSKQFEPSHEFDLQGPFEYFLSTVNVDRLEPTFQITPLQSVIPPSSVSKTGNTMDLLVVRPQFHPMIKKLEEEQEEQEQEGSIVVDSDQLKQAFVPTTVAFLTGAYKQGAHVNFVYGENGEATTTGGDGDKTPITEYYRCGGWEWTPKADDELARLVCADGTIVTIEQGGKAVCELVSEEDFGTKIQVWV